MVKLSAEQRMNVLGAFINPFMSAELTVVNKEQIGGGKCPVIVFSGSNEVLNIDFRLVAHLSIETLQELGIDETPFLTEDHDGEEEEE